MKSMFIFMFAMGSLLLGFQVHAVKIEKPTCGEASLQTALQSAALDELRFIVKNCRHQNLNLQAPLKHANSFSRIQGGILHLAVIQGWDQFLGELLQVPELNKKVMDGEGQNLLTRAFSEAQPGAVDLLLKSGFFDPNQPVVTSRAEQAQPLLFVAYEGLTRAERANEARTAFETLWTDTRLNVNAINSAGSGLWHLLVRDSKTLPLDLRERIFLDPRADRQLKNRQGQTPYGAAINRALSGSTDVLELLNQFYRLKIYNVNQVETDGTALQKAVRADQLPMVKFLIETHGADVNLPAVGANSILSLVRASKNPALIAYVLGLSQLQVASQRELLITAVKDNNWDFYKALRARPEIELVSNQFAFRFLTEVLRNPYKIQTQPLYNVVKDLLLQPQQDWTAVAFDFENLLSLSIAPRTGMNSDLRFLLWQTLKTLKWDPNQKVGKDQKTLVRRALDSRAEGADVVVGELLVIFAQDPQLDPTGLWMYAVLRGVSDFSKRLEMHPRFDWTQAGDPNEKGPRGTALQIAVDTEDLWLLQALLKFPNLNPNLPIENPPLRRLLTRTLGSRSPTATAMLEILWNDPRIDQSGLADVNLAGEKSCPAFIAAAQAGNEVVFKRLWSLGVKDPNARGCVGSERLPAGIAGYSAFDFAVRNKNANMQSILRPLLKLSAAEQNYAWQLFLNNLKTDGMLEFWNAGFRPDLNLRAIFYKGPTALALAYYLNDEALISAIDPDSKLPWDMEVTFQSDKQAYPSLPAIWADAPNVKMLQKFAADPRWSGKLLLDTIEVMFDERTTMVDESRYVIAAKILATHAKFDVQLLNDSSTDVILLASSERGGQLMPFEALFPFLQNPGLEVEGSWRISRLYAYGPAAVSLLIDHPRFDPNAVDGDSGQSARGGIFIEKKDRANFQKWLRHPKLNLSRAIQRYIVAAGEQGWIDEVQWMQKSDPGPFNPETLKAWSSVYQANAGEGEAYIDRVLKSKNAPALAKLSWLLVDAVKSPALLRSLLAKYKGWDLNADNLALGIALIENKQYDLLEELLQRSDFAMEYYYENNGRHSLGRSLFVVAVQNGDVRAYDLLMKWRGKESERVWSWLVSVAADAAELAIPDRHRIVMTHIQGRENLEGLSSHLFMPAVEHSWFDVLDLLLSFDLNLYGNYPPRTKEGEVFFVWVCREGRLDLFDLVTARTLHWINMKGSETPLIAAVKSRQVEIVRRLVKFPSLDKNLKDAQGMTAMDWAATRGYQEIVDLLK